MHNGKSECMHKKFFKMVAKVTPIAAAAFEEHKLKGKNFSSKEVDAIKAMIDGKECPLTGRAKELFKAKLD